MNWQAIKKYFQDLSAKIEWKKVSDFISAHTPELLKRYLVPAILKALGVSGGIWTWVISEIVSRLWKKTDEKIESEARVEDQKNEDQADNKQYQEDIKNEAPEAKLIEDEWAILNPGKPKPKS